MCFSTYEIERFAYEISKEVHENSRYRIVKMDILGGKNGSEHTNFNLEYSEKLPLITKLYLEGENGTVYVIEPNEHGLKFAMGKITYKEYKDLTRGENFKGLMYASISIITFVLVGWTMVEYLT